MVGEEDIACFWAERCAGGAGRKVHVTRAQLPLWLADDLPCELFISKHIGLQTCLTTPSFRQTRYFLVELQSCMMTMESSVYEKVSDFLTLMGRTELLTCSATQHSFGKIRDQAQQLTRDYNLQCLYLYYPVLKQHIQVSLIRGLFHNLGWMWSTSVCSSMVSYMESSAARGIVFGVWYNARCTLHT